MGKTTAKTIDPQDLGFLTRHKAERDSLREAYEARRAEVDSDEFAAFREATAAMHAAQADSLRAERVYAAALAAIVAKYDLDIRSDGLRLETGEIVRGVVQREHANLREARRVR